jgi:hypothetical protein
VVKYEILGMILEMIAKNAQIAALCELMLMIGMVVNVTSVVKQNINGMRKIVLSAVH